MKKNLALGLITLGSIIFTPIVNAQGNATIEFRNNSNIQVGDTFTVEMIVTDVIGTYDGVVSMGGNLSFDKEIIKYISSEATTKPYLFQINEDYNYKIAGLDFTLNNGIKEDTVVYTFTFEALKEGTTEITLLNQKLTDSQSYINTNVVAKNIMIENKEGITEETYNINQILVNENHELEESKVEELAKEKIESNEKSKVEDNKVIKDISKEEKQQTTKKSILEQIKKVFNKFIKFFK